MAKSIALDEATIVRTQVEAIQRRLDQLSIEYGLTGAPHLDLSDLPVPELRDETDVEAETRQAPPVVETLQTT